MQYNSSISINDNHNVRNEKRHNPCKIRRVKNKSIIGGSVITQQYADEIGADGYSEDANEAVKVAKRLVGGK